MNKNQSKKQQAKRDAAATDVQKFLQEMEYPVTREDVVDFMTKNAAGNIFMDRLAKLPHEIYSDFRQVLKSLRSI